MITVSQNHGKKEPVKKWKRIPACPLTPLEVAQLLTSRGLDRPLSLAEVTDLCQAAYPAYPNITTHVVKECLIYLRRRGRVREFSGHQRDELITMGVASPNPRLTYWSYVLAR